MAFLFAILTAFILYPVLSVMWIALSDEAGNLTVIHFLNFFAGRSFAKPCGTPL